MDQFKQQFEWKGRLVCLSPDLSWRDVNGELLAVNVKTGEYHVFNTVGKVIWDSVAHGERRESIIASIADRFHVDGETAKADFEEFVETLVGRRLLIECEARQEPDPGKREAKPSTGE